jgi:hypothetical protein
MTIPQIGSRGVARRPKRLRNGRRKRLREDIETIITLTRKENFLGDEILDIKHRSVKFKINMVITIKNFNR